MTRRKTTNYIRRPYDRYQLEAGGPPGVRGTGVLLVDPLTASLASSQSSEGQLRGGWQQASRPLLQRS